MTGFAKSTDILITFPAFIPTDSRDEFTILTGTGRTWPTILAFHERLLNTSTTRRGTKGPVVLVADHTLIPTDTRDFFTILTGTRGTRAAILAIHERLLNTCTTCRGAKGPIVLVPDHTLIPTDARDEFTVLVGTRGTRTTVLALKHGLLNTRTGIGVAHRSNTLEPRLARFVT